MSTLNAPLRNVTRNADGDRPLSPEHVELAMVHRAKVDAAIAEYRRVHGFKGSLTATPEERRSYFVGLLNVMKAGADALSDMPAELRRVCPRCEGRPLVGRVGCRQCLGSRWLHNFQWGELTGRHAVMNAVSDP